ncbi:MAG: type IV toxin-antitoxin system AbiEi family antitoxin domain-containing protein [Firmicutes bacterium]|nr:type IV toxin-antitoxin system AbiEi family antitoxin domain-containing protein [Bacillota bacterium]
MTASEKILKAAESNGGTITTKQVDDMNIHRTYLRTLVDKGLLEHSARGVYVLPAMLDDEFYNLQIRFKKGVFSNTSALYLLGFTDRTPIKLDMTFPASYNTSSIKNEINAHRVKKEIYEQGIETALTPSGNKVNVYCIEHTLCDILQTRYAIDIQVITDAFKRYSRRNNKNLPMLSEFAKLMRVERRVRQYLEVLI